MCQSLKLQMKQQVQLVETSFMDQKQEQGCYVGSGMKCSCLLAGRKQNICFLKSQNERFPTDAPKEFLVSFIIEHPSLKCNLQFLMANHSSKICSFPFPTCHTSLRYKTNKALKQKTISNNKLYFGFLCFLHLRNHFLTPPVTEDGEPSGT